MQDVPKPFPMRTLLPSPQTKDVFLRNEIDSAGHRRLVQWRLHESVIGGYERCKKPCENKFKLLLTKLMESFEFLYIRAQQN